MGSTLSLKHLKKLSGAIFGWPSGPNVSFSDFGHDLCMDSDFHPWPTFPPLDLRGYVCDFVSCALNTGDRAANTTRCDAMGVLPPIASQSPPKSQDGCDLEDKPICLSIAPCRLLLRQHVPAKPS